MASGVPDGGEAAAAEASNAEASRESASTVAGAERTAPAGAEPSADAEAAADAEPATPALAQSGVAAGAAAENTGGAEVPASPSSAACAAAASSSGEAAADTPAAASASSPPPPQQAPAAPSVSASASPAPPDATGAAATDTTAAAAASPRSPEASGSPSATASAPPATAAAATASSAGEAAADAAAADASASLRSPQAPASPSAPTSAYPAAAAAAAATSSTSEAATDAAAATASAAPQSPQAPEPPSASASVADAAAAASEAAADTAAAASVSSPSSQSPKVVGETAAAEASLQQGAGAPAPPQAQTSLRGRRPQFNGRVLIPALDSEVMVQPELALDVMSPVAGSNTSPSARGGRTPASRRGSQARLSTSSTPGAERKVHLESAEDLPQPIFFEERAVREAALVHLLPEREFSIDDEGQLVLEAVEAVRFEPTLADFTTQKDSAEAWKVQRDLRVDLAIVRNQLLDTLLTANGMPAKAFGTREPVPSPSRRERLRSSVKSAAYSSDVIDDIAGSYGERFRELCTERGLRPSELACVALSAIAKGERKLPMEFNGRAYLGNRCAEALFETLAADLFAPVDGFSQDDPAQMVPHRVLDLRALDFSGQGLGNEAAVALAQLLPCCPTLQELNLARNNISEHGAHRLLKQIQKHPALDSVSLDRNPVPSWIRVRITETIAKRRARTAQTKTVASSAEAA
eukprot:TRINITY_DN6173_c0_g3_i1.p1 TRINITY_DN6173_c0_g3~~TRINITY_DN6173_c0_g3_i1.p1  ORF type:complete len:718 (-),score=193.29 TRINITY_DN6173_c0_g3_i1:63-2156(-)